MFVDGKKTVAEIEQEIKAARKAKRGRRSEKPVKMVVEDTAEETSVVRSGYAHVDQEAMEAIQDQLKQEESLVEKTENTDGEYHEELETLI